MHQERMGIKMELNSSLSCVQVGDDVGSWCSRVITRTRHVMRCRVRASNAFLDPLKRWAGDDMNETSFAETTGAVDVASRVLGRNRPETT